MLSKIAGEKAEELTDQRIIRCVGAGARHHDLATGTDAVVDLVAFAESEGAAHGFRNRGLITVGQCGFGFKGGGHDRLR